MYPFLKKCRLFFFISLAFLAFTACDNDDGSDDDEMMMTRQVWTGADLTFVKADSVDVTLEANQDRITDEVWITRDEGGGQIFNIRVESESDKDTSPAGTKWAEGAISEIDNLNFRNFRDAVKPQEVVGKNLVMWIEDENIYLSVRFTSWSMQRKGGFSYVRSTR